MSAPGGGGQRGGGGLGAKGVGVAVVENASYQPAAVGLEDVLLPLSPPAFRPLRV